MASIHTDPFVADMIEARQHDERLIERRFFEADTEGEESDVPDCSTGPECAKSFP